MVTIPTRHRTDLTHGNGPSNAAVISDRPRTNDVGPLCHLLAAHGFEVDFIRTDEVLSRETMARPYDVVLLDLLRLDGDGQHTCSRLRTQDDQLPIVILSNENTVADRIKGYESGADEYISKPFSPREVSVRLRSLLRRTGAHKPQNTLNYDDLSVDLASRAVSRADVPIDLSRREFSLLVYLIQNAECVLSREQILEHVWASTTTPERSNVVDVYINYLRNKTEQGQQHGRLIQTVRGKGYMLHRLAI